MDICRRLDGVPLAIELAAARITVLPPKALLARSATPSAVADGRRRRTSPERLRAMRAGIAWSYDLLSADEQHLFRRLAVFAGAFTLAAAEAVGPGERLGRVSRSSPGWWTRACSSRLTSSGEPRFVMLETIREYAVEQLAASGEETDARRAHAAYFLRLAEEAGSGLRGALQQQWRDGSRPTWTICGPRWHGP